MKFTVTCLVSSVNSGLLPEAEKLTKDVVVAKPKATLQNLRATVAIQFRLNVVAFDFHFTRHSNTPEPKADVAATAPPSSSPSDPPAASVDLSDEKKLLTECGLRDGDYLTVLPRHHRPSATLPASADATNANGGPEDGEEETYGGPAKKARVEEGVISSIGGEAGEGGEEEEEESITDEEDEEDDSDADEPAQDDLFDALREVVPDLTVLRQEFLSNPQAVMERIERNHPSLFQVITQNQETFIRLMNNEQLTKAAQSMLHGRPALGGGDGDSDEEQSVEWSMNGEEEDEEMDEETEAQMRELFEHYIAAGEAAGDFDAADLAALEASGMQVGDVDEHDGEENGSGGGAQAGGAAKKPASEKEFILARVPTEDDEKKIQALTELGFSYEQCKLAFYLCHRSIDRASNMLFEAPPEI